MQISSTVKFSNCFIAEPFLQLPFLIFDKFRDIKLLAIIFETRQQYFLKKIFSPSMKEFYFQRISKLDGTFWPEFPHYSVMLTGCVKCVNT